MLNLYSILSRSMANGPGTRTVIWFQGCNQMCQGCFNPATHSSKQGKLLSTDILVNRLIFEQEDMEGITISGGEPLQQPEGLLQLLNGIRISTNLSVLLFSGLTMTEILNIPMGRDILANVDVLIDGRYDSTLHLSIGLRGSSNQKVHLLTDRYSMAEIEHTPAGEILLDQEGNVFISGIDPLKGI